MGTLELGQQLASAGAAYQSQLLDLQKQDQGINARYTGDPNGALDFIDPKDPFSVTGAAKRLFRQQQDQQKYSAFAGGYGLDGSTVEQAANLGIDQDQRKREITDQFTAEHNAVGSARTAAAGGWGETQASFGAQIASAFADENNATLGAATPAAPSVGEKGGAPSTPVKHEFKRVGGKLYRRIQGAGQKWVLVG